MAIEGPLAAELRSLRLAAGLTQEGLAERARLSVRAVSDTERGLRTRLYPGTTARLAAALGLTGAARERFAAAARGMLPAGAGAASRLPRPATPLVGRGAELAELAGLLGDPQVRLATITGPPGVGKTRLALATASECAAQYEDGVVFVQLASAHDAASAGLAIATAVGANATHGTVSDVVAAAIGERRLLLVCDTFEVVPDAATLIAGTLDRCPRLTVLMTSRAPLRLSTEHLYQLAPLEPGAAAVLFAERAAAARPGADLSGTEVLVARVCDRVQGIPLAVELAAARMAHLGLADLLGRLGAQLEVLTGGPVDKAARHRTLEATIAWSYGLLGQDRREALARLSVFDGWSLPAAAAVLGGDPLPGVSALVDQSLAIAPTPAGEDGRYLMLDAVREFGAAQLKAMGADSGTRDRHAAWFLATAEASSAAMRASGQHRVHRALVADLGNLRLAFRRFTDADRGAEALRLATALWMFWLWQGGFAEGRAWLRAALAGAHDADPHLRAAAHRAAGWLAYHQGDLAETRINAGALAQLAETSGLPLERRNARTLEGMMALAERRLDDAARLMGDALTSAREIVPADPWVLAVSILNEGAGLIHVGQLTEAAQRFAEARAAFAALGDETYRARASRHLAAVRVLEGHAAEAGSLLDESLLIVDDADDRWGLAETLSGMAQMAAASHDARRAGALEARAAVVRRALGVVQHPFDAILAERHLGPLRDDEQFRAGSAEADSLRP